MDAGKANVSNCTFFLEKSSLPSEDLFHCALFDVTRHSQYFVVVAVVLVVVVLLLCLFACLFVLVFLFGGGCFLFCFVCLFCLFNT